MCLILDGYDEIGDKNFENNDFLNMLSQHIERLKYDDRYKRQSIVVVISTRQNYYIKNRFDGFTPLKILPLSNADINCVLQNNGIDVRGFYNQIQSNALSEMIKNPFFFWHIIRLYKQNNSLPKKDELMQRVVDHLMEKNYEKYNGNITGITIKTEYRSTL